MSKISSPRRKPIAGFGAPVLRGSRPAIEAAMAGVLIAILAFPAVLVAPHKTEAASATSMIPTPLSAPPEPFVIHSSSRFSGLAATAIGVATRALAAFSAEELPAGLEGAKLPTPTERLSSFFQPLLAFVTPSESAVRDPRSSIEPPPPPAQPSSVVDFDFDNDGKADVGRWHSANTELKVRNSNGGSYSTFTVGSSAARLAPGDFNGDGKTDAAVFNAGSWKYKTSTSGSEQTISWGASGDVPVAGDYDGDGTTDAAIYRPSNNSWWILKSSGGSTSTSFGSTGEIPVPGDYDGDGKNDLALFQPSSGDWHITPSSTALSYTFHWGISIDTPVPADYDADGKTDPAVFRPSTGTWYVYRSGLNNGSYYMQSWGNYADQPVPGDYDGDNKADYAIWRPTTGLWYILNSSDSSYTSYALGVPGDTAVPSAYLKQVGGEVSGDALAAARLQPRNATGGTDLYSQNFSWGTSLVGLPGRAGLDAGFGISYNSLVWTKVGSAIVFDADSSNAGPGFRFGFPVIEPIHYDSGKSLWSYIMVTPSGGRAEFRQTSVSNTYETADSSYAQLVTTGATNPNDPVEDVTIKVTTTNGTQMTYGWNTGAYRCSQIKDRNGNYITIAYDFGGRLDTVTDTLGRVLTVNYDGTTGFPSTITQTWKTNNGEGSGTATHTWATFTYATATVDTDFASSLATIVGPPDDTVVNVLDKITYPDGSATRFEYNGYLQVKKISSIAADSSSHILNYISTNLDSPSSSQPDCPRFTETRSKVENFNLNSSNEPQEVAVTNSNPTSATYSLPGSISGSASRIDVAVTGHPDGLYSRTYVGSSGWKEGLTLATEDCIGTNCSDRKRWTWTDWTQDSTSAAYITNPRVKETQIGDTSNTKKTKVYYYEPSTGSFPYGLPEKVEIYASNLTSVLKTQTTAYNLSSSYTNKRIIGLPSETKLFEGTSTGTLMSKVTYAYDEGNFSDSGLGQNISPTRHDATYDSTFIAGRGNLTSTTRWNVDYPTSSTYAVTNSMKYNTAGAVVSRTDPMSRTVKIGYGDVWNDGVSRSTYAYPTTITDPAGSSLSDSTHSSTVKYRYDIGANVEATSPAPTGESYGKKSKRIYDSYGRLERDSIYLNTTEYSYSRYEYPTNGIQSKVYSTVVDTDSDGADADDELLSESWADGAGRVRLSRAPHTFNTNGTTATWAGSVVEYDLLGRVTRQSVPTEVDSARAAAGDDYARGYLWTYQKYDWKDRVVRTIKTDGDPNATSNDSDVLVSYDGCGCAGGQVTTVQGENIVETDWQGNNPTTLGRRKQKIYDDILGRQIKTETFAWDGSTVYSTTTHTYNGRDQITTTRQYAGSTSSSTYRDVTMAYDGHGRMATRHYPIEDTGANTSWTYNADDSINTVTDPRGVVTSFTYYSTTGLLNQIAYTVPSGQASTVDDTPDVTFAYDNLGNRTSMTDGTGSVSYVYNELSRLESETRTITGVTGSFPINYTYMLSGAVKTFTDPQSSSNVATYGFDKLGRTVSLQRASEGSIHDTTFRAWGAIKEYRTSAYQSGDYSYDRFSYDNGLNVSRYQLGSNTLGDGEAHDYQRYADGAVKYIAAEYGPTSDNPTFDRLYRYDSVGRLIQGKSGFEVNGRTDWGSETPYRNNMSYNAFSEVDSVSGQHWGRTVTSPGYTIAGTTGRVSTSGYDAAGNITLELIDAVPNPDINRTMKYDAAGRNVYIHDPIVHTCCENDHQYDTTFDGNGWRVRKVDASTPPNQSSITDTVYEFRSTVFGGEVVGRLAMASWHTAQSAGWVTPINGVKWGDDPAKTAPEGIKTGGVELDTRGADVGAENPYNTGDGGTGYPGTGGDPTQAHRCAAGGVPEPCDPNSRAEMAYERIAALIIKDSKKRADEKAKEKAAASERGRVDDGGNGRSTSPTSPTEKPADDPVRTGIVGFMSYPCDETDPEVICTRVKRLLDAGMGMGGGNESLQKKPRRKLTGDESKKLRTSIEGKYGTKNGTKTCLDKLNAVLKALGSSYKDFGSLIADLFEDKNGRTLTITKEPANSSHSADTLGGSVVLNASVSLDNHDIDTMHEAFHAANKRNNYGHFAIAQAIAQVEGLNIDNYVRQNNKKKEIGGGLINSFIGQYCSPGGSAQWAGWLERFK